VKRFILCLGYKREVFVDYFMNFAARENDITLTLGRNPKICYHTDNEEADWEVTLADTGLETMTGGRILRAAKYLHAEDENFFLTYGDGVSDVDLKKLLKSHLESGRALTVSAVHTEGRFGEMRMNRDGSIRFSEKPQKSDSYINGGFMVLNKKAVLPFIPADHDTFFEAEPMSAIAAAGKMNAYLHNGFWQCMDTPREHALLNKMWEQDQAPWTKSWKTGGAKSKK